MNIGHVGLVDTGRVEVADTWHAGTDSFGDMGFVGHVDMGPAAGVLAD